MQATIEWKPADAWVGLFWKRTLLQWPMWGDRGTRVSGWKYDVWVCVVPMLPLHLSWRDEDSRAWATPPEQEVDHA